MEALGQMRMIIICIKPANYTTLPIWLSIGVYPSVVFIQQYGSVALCQLGETLVLYLRNTRTRPLRWGGRQIGRAHV